MVIRGADGNTTQECRIGPSEASSCRLQVLEYETTVDAVVIDALDTVSGVRCGISLRGAWRESKICQGDIVRIILSDADGKFLKWDTAKQFTEIIIVDDVHNLFIQHPDVLLPGSAIADSVTCLRKTVLTARSPGAGGAQSAAALFGNMIHELFQTVLVMLADRAEMDEMELSMLPLDIVSSKIAMLYQMNISFRDAVSVVGDALGPILEWHAMFFRKMGDMSVNGNTLRNADHVVIDRLQDIEELVWSPCTGLKGKIDATVNICKRDGESSVAVMELKTGYSKGLAGLSHHAQVALYTLLLSDRYETTVSDGLLSYIPSTYRKRLEHGNEQSDTNGTSKATSKSNASHSVFIKSHRGEIVGLVMQRNMVAYYLRPRTDFTELPPLLSREEMKCRKCYARQSCMVQNKLLENGYAVNMGDDFDQDLYEKQTGHLNDIHSEYYNFWRGILAAEEAEASRPQKEVWISTAMERAAYGRCIANLRLVPNDEDTGMIESDKSCETFAIEHRGRNISMKHAGNSVSVGDYVVVSVEKVLGDDDNGGLMPMSSTTWKPALSNGFLHSINENTVSVKVERNLTRWARKQRYDLRNMVWRIDAEEIFASHKSAKSNLEGLFASGEEDKHGNLRSLIVNCKSPRFTTLSTAEETMLKERHEQLSTIGVSLNTEQKFALSFCQQAQDYMLLLGMPGTGKTMTLAAIVMMTAQQNKSVLLCSHTHSAVDNVLLKLLEFGFTDFARLGRAKHVTDDRIKPYLVHTYNAKTVEELEQALETPRVLATTCLSITHPVFSRRDAFDLVVIDEASQILQPICIGPLLFADGKFILVGDHYQLPPLIRAARNGVSSNTEPVSLFRRLCEKHPHSVVSLTQQYRMSEEIMNLSNHLVYSGCLTCGNTQVARQQLQITAHTTNTTPNWIRAVLDPTRKVLFLDTDIGETDNKPAATETRQQDSDKTRKNMNEVHITTQAIQALCTAGMNPCDITVLSPFRAQIGQFRRHFHTIDKLDTDLTRINLYTIDQYQGRDNDCVFISFVRSGQSAFIGPLLSDWRRINVALTRAKCKLVLVGSRDTLYRAGPFFRCLIEFLKLSVVSASTVI